MNIKPLDWRRTSLRKITANGKPTVTEMWEAHNRFAAYKVYRAASGNYFVLLPEPDKSGLPGFHADSFLGSPKARCASIADGKRVAGEHWARMASTILV